MTRLDQYLVTAGHARSRAQAQALIKARKVSRNGVIAKKPSDSVATDDALDIAYDENDKWVSRAAQKLDFALEETGWDATDRIALDIGASTGGFCQVLLERGARKVFAIDVGQNQLDARLANDPRLLLREKLNAKDINKHSFDDTDWPNFDIITIDVSFISLTKALPAALNMARPATKLIALIKPQFEVGKAAIGKNGIVKDEAAQNETREVIYQFLNAEAWSVEYKATSPIEGGDGNVEFLVGAIKQ